MYRNLTFYRLGCILNLVVVLVFMCYAGYYFITGPGKFQPEDMWGMIFICFLVFVYTCNDLLGLDLIKRVHTGEIISTRRRIVIIIFYILQFLLQLVVAMLIYDLLSSFRDYLPKGKPIVMSNPSMFVLLLLLLSIFITGLVYLLLNFRVLKSIKKTRVEAEDMISNIGKR